MVKKRAGWLTVLMIGEMLTATVMGYFEHQIAKAVVLRTLRAAGDLVWRQLGLAGLDAGHSRAWRWASCG
jgi:hypothetical protein